MSRRRMAHPPYRTIPRTCGIPGRTHTIRIRVQRLGPRQHLAIPGCLYELLFYFNRHVAGRGVPPPETWTYRGALCVLSLKAGLYFVPTITSTETKIHQKDHLIIVGFGLNGRNVARSARAAGIPYVIIEMNPETVRAEKSKGEPIYFGDAIQEAVLAHARIKGARVLVVVISDPTATRRIIEIARRLNPTLYIIARTRFVQEMKHLYELGANEVIPEEFETSVEIFTRVLVKYLMPRDEIERFTAEVRTDGYEMLRCPSGEPASMSDLKIHLPDIEISTFRVNQGSPLVRKSLAQIELRKKYGVTLLAIRRDSQTLSDIGGETEFYANDILVLLAPSDKIAALTGLFHGSEKGV